MRYIGNKTRLLGFIGDVLKRRGIRAGTAADPFTGTASVARALKAWGHAVHAADMMEYGYVFGRAYVEVGEPPQLDGLADELDGHDATLEGVVAHLNALAPRPGFLHRHFTPGGDEGRANGRMYFTAENAARIDAIRETLDTWHAGALIGEDALHVVLAALIEAADQVANTAGVYAACIKSWQPNAVRPLRLEPPRITPGNSCRATRGDALELLAAAEPFDLLYLDPPYNSRQYAGYYHVPELIATGWFEQPPALRGKTGLLPDREKRSDWSRRNRCESALEALLARARCTHVVMSYNSEGIIPEPTIERLLKEWGRTGTYRRYTRAYKRYRSDADGIGRRYRGDEVQERLYCVSR